MTSKSANMILAVAGIASVVAFFLPFLDFGGIASASGWEILVADHIELTTRIAMLALPLGGLALIGAGASSHPKARLVGVVFGLGVYGFLGFQMLRVFFAATGLGLWLTLGAAAAAVVAALSVKKKS